MYALSLRQPWASLVAGQQKRIETRSWNTAHRGTIAIHASKAFQRGDMELCFGSPFLDAMLAMGIRTLGQLPRGAIIAIAEIAATFRTTEETEYEFWECSGKWNVNLSDAEMDFGDFTPGRYGWILTEVEMLKEPIFCRGYLGLWTVPFDIEERICHELNLPTA